MRVKKIRLKVKWLQLFEIYASEQIMQEEGRNAFLGLPRRPTASFLTSVAIKTSGHLTLPKQDPGLDPRQMGNYSRLTGRA